MPSLSELVGKQKVRSDIRSVPYRHRYLSAPAVGPSVTNGPVRFTLPKSNAGYLDVSTLRWRGLLNVSTVDATARVAGHDLSVLIDRVRVMNGNKVVYDQEQNSLISNFTNGLVGVCDTMYENYERKLSDYPEEKSTATRTSQITTAHTANRLCIAPLGPEGSFVNSSHIIPLQFMNSPVHVDIYFAEPSTCFLSSDTALTYSLTDFELNWSALYSPSLDQHYASNSVSIHVTEFGHRYNQIAAGTSQINLLIPSNHSNCSGILTFMRDQNTNVSDITQEKLENANVPATDLAEVDFRIATRSIYAEPLDDVSQYYNQLKHLYPQISKSRYFTPTGIESSQFVQAVNLSGAPGQFGGVGGSLVSGVQSSTLNTDMSMKLTFNAPTTSVIECSHYVLSDVVYTFMNGMINVTL